MNPSVFEAMGGAASFERLVRDFYLRVRTDDVLAPMYAGDFDGGERRLRLFLMQYWGGPTTYSDERGHPMLRRRHIPFHIGPEARTRWLTHMRAALDEISMEPDLKDALWDYLRRAAFAMQNQEGDEQVRDFHSETDAPSGLMRKDGGTTRNEEEQ